MKGKIGEIQKVFEEDINLKSYGLKVVETEESVTVSGIVDSLSEKKYTEKLIKDVAGNKDVDLAVSISTDGAIDDEDVTMEVAEEIAAHPELNGRIMSRIEKGVVYLTGSVDDEELIEEAVEAASRARGVIDVTSDIKVNREENMNEPEKIFHSQVKNDQDG